MICEVTYYFRFRFGENLEYPKKMGVPTFFKWICTRYPKVISDAVEKSCVEIDGRDVPVDYEEPNPNGVEVL